MQRPTTVTVFGILNVVFAIIGFFASLASLMMFTAAAASTNNPVIQLVHDNPNYAAWMKISVVLGVLVSVLLLAAGIGLLKLQSWARIASIVYGIYSIVMVIVGSVINYFFLVQPLLQQAQQKQGPEATGAAIGGAIGGMFGSCFGIIYPVLLLIFMMKANVKAAFGTAAPPPLPPGPGA